MAWLDEVQNFCDDLAGLPSVTIEGVADRMLPLASFAAFDGLNIAEGTEEDAATTLQSFIALTEFSARGNTQRCYPAAGLKSQAQSLLDSQPIP